MSSGDRDGAPLRIGLAGLWHETNTFAPGLTSFGDFRAYRLADGAAAVRAAHAGTESELGGALAACEATGHEAVPLLSAAAVPGPLVEAEAYAELRSLLLGRLEEAGRLDVLLLALHGGMVVDGLDDPESDLLAAIRERAGSIPIAVVLDLHANPGDGLLEEADLLLAYRTYPHTDAGERAAQAVGLLVETIEGSLAPLVTGRRLPLLTAPLAQATAGEPMASLLARARSLEARPGVAAVSLVPGFPYADVERLGFAVVATGEDAAANAAADELAQAVWGRRDAFRVEPAGVEEAVETALRGPGPFVLADVGDNVGGGAPGDSSVLLRALLDSGADGAVVVIHDPPAAGQADGEVELAVGTPPVAVRGRARRLGSVRYRRTGTYMKGTEVDLGACTVVDAGGVEVVLTSRRAMPFDADHLRAVGIEPAERRILVVKSALAWQGGLADVAAGSLAVDTPGPTTCRLEELPYANVRRPVVPLDAM